MGVPESRPKTAGADIRQRRERRSVPLCEAPDLDLSSKSTSPLLKRSALELVMEVVFSRSVLFMFRTVVIAPVPQSFPQKTMAPRYSCAIDIMITVMEGNVAAYTLNKASTMFYGYAWSIVAIEQEQKGVEPSQTPLKTSWPT